MELAALDLALKCYHARQEHSSRKRAWDECTNHSAPCDDIARNVEQHEEMHARLTSVLGSSMQQHSGCYLVASVEEVEFECNVHNIGHHVSFVPPGRDERVLGIITQILIVDPPNEINGPRRCLLELGLHGSIFPPADRGLCASAPLNVKVHGHVVDISVTTLVRAMRSHSDDKAIDACMWVLHMHHA